MSAKYEEKFRPSFYDNKFMPKHISYLAQEHYSFVTIGGDKIIPSDLEVFRVVKSQLEFICKHHNKSLKECMK